MVSHVKNAKEEDGKREKGVEVQAAVQVTVVMEAKKGSTKAMVIKDMATKDSIKAMETKVFREAMEVSGDDEYKVIQ